MYKNSLWFWMTISEKVYHAIRSKVYQAILSKVYQAFR